MYWKLGEIAEESIGQQKDKFQYFNTRARLAKMLKQAHRVKNVLPSSPKEKTFKISFNLERS